MGEKTRAKSSKHHYVPQGYLRGFARDDKRLRLFVLNKEYSSIRPTTPAGVGYIPDFYTVNTINEKDSSEVEDGLSKIESTCIPLLAKLANGDELSKAEIADIAIFIALQYGRTPAARENMDEVGTTLVTNMIKAKMAGAINDEAEYKKWQEEMLEKAPHISFPSREKMIEWVLKPGPLANMKIDNGTFTKTFFESAEHQAQGLLGCEWRVLVAPKGTHFITTDNPIGLRATRPLLPYQRLAILLPGVHRFFPLNDHAVLMITDSNKGWGLGHGAINGKFLMLINQLLYRQANQYVIAGADKLLTNLMRIDKINTKRHRNYRKT